MCNYSIEVILFSRNFTREQFELRSRLQKTVRFRRKSFGRFPCILVSLFFFNFSLYKIKKNILSFKKAPFFPLQDWPKHFYPNGFLVTFCQIFNNFLSGKVEGGEPCSLLGPRGLPPCPDLWYLYQMVTQKWVRT